MTIVKTIVRLSSHVLRKFVDAVLTVQNFSHIIFFYYTSLTLSMYLFMYTRNKKLILGLSSSLFFFAGKHWIFNLISKLKSFSWPEDAWE